MSWPRHDQIMISDQRRIACWQLPVFRRCVCDRDFETLGVVSALERRLVPLALRHPGVYNVSRPRERGSTRWIHPTSHTVMVSTISPTPA